jgi:DNA mismatch repair ATPase MutS
VKYTSLISCPLDDSWSFGVNDSNNNSNGEEDDDDDDEQLPLYRLRLGVAPSSDGIACARTAGVPTNVLRRAAEVKEAVSSRRPITALPALHRSSVLQDAKHRALLKLFLSLNSHTHTHTSGDAADADSRAYEELLRVLIQ